MKNKLTIIALLAYIAVFPQNISFTAGVDIRNSVTGSDATKNNPEIDCLLKFGMVNASGVEATVGFEQFSAIDFNKFYLGIGYQIKITDKLIIVPTLEPTLINRYDDWGGGLGYKDNESSHLALGLSCPIRYNFNENFAIEIHSNLLPRVDLKAKYSGDMKYVVSNYICVVYKLTIN